MADLRSRFIEDYAGGLLNVSRQELASNGEVLSQDGFLSDASAFVEDGTGTKSGLKLGVGIAEAVDPTSAAGLVNVRYADRTYTKIRDTKIFATAIASAQAALAESVSESLSNVESAIDSIEISITQNESRTSALETEVSELSSELSAQNEAIADLASRFKEDIEAAVLGSDPDTNNVRVGLGALESLRNGVANVGIGLYSLSALVNGNENIGLGSRSGSNLTQGNNNLILGNDSKVSRPNTSNEIILGNSLHNYFWAKTDVYTPSATLSGNDLISNSATSADFFKFVKSLRFRRIKWEQGQTTVVIDPASLRRAEETLGLRGYVHSESSSVSNAKLVPILLQTLSGVFDLLGLDFTAIDPLISGGPDSEDPDFTSVDNNPGSVLDDFEGANPVENFQKNFFPIGGIIMWSNYGDAEIPTGWHLCNGERGTPDLRNKFIIGAGSTEFPLHRYKDEGPIVPLHRHGGVAEWKVVNEMVVIPAPDGSIPPGLAHGTNSSNAQVDPMDGSGEFSEAMVSAALNIEAAGKDASNLNDRHETFPPYYALAYIMRLS